MHLLRIHRADLRISLTWVLAFLLAVTLGALPARSSAQEEEPAVEEGAAEAPPVEATPPGDGDVASLYRDFIHFTRLGRFDAAGAYATQLLEHPALDPVQLLAIAEKERGSIETLLMAVQNAPISDAAQRVLDVIRKGELEERRDPARIKANVEKLSGPPQTEYNAIQRLRESGEYAIPWMIDALRRQDQKALWPRIAHALPQIGKAAVSPLVVALEIDDPDVRITVAKALGEIGYTQAIPHLQKYQLREGVYESFKQAAADAIVRIEKQAGRPAGASPSMNFVALAEQYYNEEGSVKADPRLSTANVWYVKDGFLTAVAVPTEIYGPVMAMRTAKEALLLAPDTAEAIALWLAGNVRREARLGMDVESEQDDPNADQDATTPPGFPRSIYFCRAAGPLYCHRVLERAVRDRDPAVALGAIAALRVTAGEKSLVGTEDYKQPLVQALKFPDRVVRIKAALALADALPKSAFAGSDLVPLVLSEALSEAAGQRFVVIDADPENLNRVLSELRAEEAEVVGEGEFYSGLARAREGTGPVTCFYVATNVGAPDLAGALQQLRGELPFAVTPVVLLVKAGQAAQAERLAQSARGVTTVDAGAGLAELSDAYKQAAESSGQTALEAEQALGLALEAAGVIRRVAIDGRTVIHHAATEPALLTTLNSESEALRIEAAAALALFDSATAQQAIARVALDPNNSESLRVAVFGSLAESARAHGNKLDDPVVAELVQVTADEPALSLRTAASQALGALNLRDNKASAIIRKYDPH